MYNLLAKTDIFLAQVDRIDSKKNIIIKITKNMGRGTAQFFVTVTFEYKYSSLGSSFVNSVAVKLPEILGTADPLGCT